MADEFVVRDLDLRGENSLTGEIIDVTPRSAIQSTARFQGGDGGHGGLVVVDFVIRHAGVFVDDGVQETKDDWTYRLSRMLSTEAIPEPAQRAAQVDVDRIWAERTAQFLYENQVPVVVCIKTSRLEELLENARAVRAEEPEPDDWVRLDVTFEDLRHAVWAVWRLNTDAKVLGPESVRDAMYVRAKALTARYRT